MFTKVFLRETDENVLQIYESRSRTCIKVQQESIINNNDSVPIAQLHHTFPQLMKQ